MANKVALFPALLSFFILHLLVYPSSNGYNSYIDRDETPIGGLSNPLQPTRQLFYLTVLMDALAVLLSLLVSAVFAAGITLYIVASRAYSSKEIRLKKYPLIGFLVVFVCQGAVIFYSTHKAVDPDNHVPLLPSITASCLIGALYPLTQIYQHEADRRAGVKTISIFLGKKGSFLFSSILYLLATLLFYVYLQTAGTLNYFFMFLLITLPVIGYFLVWMRRVWKNGEAANFQNSLRMNVVATFFTALYFLTLIILRH